MKKNLTDFGGIVAIFAGFLIFGSLETYFGLGWATLVSVLGYLDKEQDTSMSIFERVTWMTFIVLLAVFTGMYYAGWPPAPNGVMTL